MFSTLRTRFGIPGVISVMALVFAMFGGAYAASNSSGGGKATASAAKGKPGPRGKTGKTGPVGPQGPAGPTGPAGAKGDAGAPGSNGTPGAPGTSVKNEAEPKGLNCKEGGTKLVGTTTTFACNGEKGKDGIEGSPWTLGGTLPSEATETGVWRFVSHNTVVQDGEGNVSEKPEPVQWVPISFPIPLSSDVIDEISFESHATVVGPSANCPGTAEEPKAAPGFLCVYASPFETNFNGNPVGPYRLAQTGEEETGVNTAGALLAFEPLQPNWHSSGSFAITAP